LKSNPTSKELINVHTPTLDELQLAESVTRNLVANCLIFYNVFEMSRMLNQLMQEGYSFSDEAIAALSPDLTEPVNRLGRYPLDFDRRPPALEFEIHIKASDQTPDPNSSPTDKTPALTRLQGDSLAES
jgi:hypothetical protein